MSSSIYKAPSEVARLQRLALIAGVVGLVLLGGGALVGPSSYFMKTPPVQFTDNEARNRTELFIKNKEQDSVKSEKPLSLRRE